MSDLDREHVKCTDIITQQMCLNVMSSEMWRLCYCYVLCGGLECSEVSVWVPGLI